LNDRDGIRFRADVEASAATAATLAAINRKLIAHTADRFALMEHFFWTKLDTKATGFTKFRLDDNTTLLIGVVLIAV